MALGDILKLFLVMELPDCPWLDYANMFFPWEVLPYNYLQFLTCILHS